MEGGRGGFNNNGARGRGGRGRGGFNNNGARGRGGRGRGRGMVNNNGGRGVAAPVPPPPEIIPVPQQVQPADPVLPPAAPPQFPCFKCNKWFTELKKLKSHNKSSNAHAHDAAFCGRCNNKMLNKSRLLVHLESKEHDPWI